MGETNDTVEVLKVEAKPVTLREMPEDIVRLMKSLSALDGKSVPEIWCSAAKLLLTSRGFINNEGQILIKL